MRESKNQYQNHDQILELLIYWKYQFLKKKN